MSAPSVVMPFYILGGVGDALFLSVHGSLASREVSVRCSFMFIHCRCNGSLCRQLCKQFCNSPNVIAQNFAANRCRLTREL